MHESIIVSGQGVQKVGMLNSLFEEVSEVKSIIDERFQIPRF